MTSITDYTMMASLSNIERWGTILHIRKTTVASHTMDVCWTVDWAVNRVLPATSAERHLEVLRWAMRHDMMEGLTGDIPSPPKRIGIVREHLCEFEQQYPRVARAMNDPSEWSRKVVKMADRMCMLRDARAEVEMGNRVFVPLIGKCHDMAIQAIEVVGKMGPFAGGMGAPEVLSAYMAECPPAVGISLIVEQEMEP